MKIISVSKSDTFPDAWLVVTERNALWLHNNQIYVGEKSRFPGFFHWWRASRTCAHASVITRGTTTDQLDKAVRDFIREEQP